jgi:large subunit ribosomal protein L32
MTPLPKRKLSKGRKNRRRAHDAIGTPSLVACANCGERKMPHRVCPSCGYYRSKQIVDMDAAKS